MNGEEQKIQLTARETKCLLLVARETKCLLLAAQDKSLNDTAECMHVEPDTVKKYRARILRKLGCQTMVGALAIAIRNNLFTLTR